MNKKFSFILSDACIEESEGIGAGIVFNAELKHDIYEVTWSNERGTKGTIYDKEEVEGFLNDGIWLIKD